MIMGMAMDATSCFKAYDIRGHFPNSLNEDFARALGRSIAQFLEHNGKTAPIHVVIGRDCRMSGPALSEALVCGLRQGNVHVFDLGLCGTEEIYHATFSQTHAHAHVPHIHAGIMITGSHNPAQENGFKLVRTDAIPISADSGLWDIRHTTLAILREGTKPLPLRGSYTPISLRQNFVRFLLDLVDKDALHNAAFGSPALRIHADAGNGCAGLVLQELTPHVPFAMTFAHMEPDGTFPHGVPNPLLPEKRHATAQAVRDNAAHMGIAWDGDFDRCFFYDEHGTFVEGYYIVGLLAQSLLYDFPHEKIVHDPRLMWNTQELVHCANGTPILSQSGHSFMKDTMRRENALYGGEMSAHHFFRHFAFADSGMIPWLLMAKLLLKSGKSLGQLLKERVEKFPCSGEINRRVAHVHITLQRLEEHFGKDALHVHHLDGLSVEYDDWRFNVRPSHTEALLRCNVEARGSVELMEKKTQEVLTIIESTCSSIL